MISKTIGFFGVLTIFRHTHMGVSLKSWVFPDFPWVNRPSYLKNFIHFPYGGLIGIFKWRRFRWTMNKIPKSSTPRSTVFPFESQLTIAAKLRNYFMCVTHRKRPFNFGKAKKTIPNCCINGWYKQSTYMWQT